MEPVGSEVTIAGQPATVWIYGNIWASKATTSREFVSATLEVPIEGLNATAHARKSQSPASPTTRPAPRAR